ncbi:11928_t:CDS:10, partial [Acaulospora morrowiae]
MLPIIDSSKVIFGLKRTLSENGIKLLISNKRYSQVTSAPKPLEGIRVLELGQIVAGPFCGTILGYYGAEVIKVESPGTGDTVRALRGIDIDGVSPWFRAIGRNKKSCEINLRTEEGRKLARQLADRSDVLIENFRPGVMEKWGLGPEELYKTNPSIVYTRISGFGQTGPYAKRPGFASVCEAVAGWRHINRFRDQPLVRQNLSLGDSLAGLTAALGIVMCLLVRKKFPPNARSGQEIDVAIYESVLNMMEGVLPEYDRFGEIRQPAGNSATDNAYLCSDSKYIVIDGDGEFLHEKLMKVIEREDLVTAECKANKESIQHKELINAILDWTKKHTSKEVLEKLEKEEIPCAPVYNIKDIVEDEHFRKRDLFETVRVGENMENGGWDLKLSAITPKLSATPGGTTWAGPDLGQHNREILMDFLGLGEDEIRELQKNGII